MHFDYWNEKKDASELENRFWRRKGHVPGIRAF